MTHNQSNILAVWQLATLTEQQDGAAWYPAALRISRKLAERYSVTLEQAAGVIAALSPRNRWERNVIDAERLISAYVFGGPEQAAATKVCTFTTNKTKAIAILAAEDADSERVLEILSGPKLREFYSCIIGLDDVCIDGHAYCIWAGNRTGLKDVPSIGVKLRRQIKADYAAAAATLGVPASVCQAVTWCAWRRIHGVAN